MDSHEYAGKLREAAAFLESRPVFALYSDRVGDVYLPYYDKEVFVAAARALGTLDKTIDECHYTVVPVACPMLHVFAPRSTVCRKVQDVKYECEPLLSDDEAAALGTEAVTNGA
jgi:hypothetical protein